VLITHAHVDHCGLLPKLVREGFVGKIYCTVATAEIGRIVLLDSAKLQMEDAAYKKKRHKKEGRKGKHPEEPLYTVEDAEETFPLFTSVRYQQPVELADGIEARFFDAGHILGASMIQVTVNKNHEKRVILFSGDVGRWDKPILRDPTVFEEADYVLIESTYGDRLHEDDVDCKESLAKIINHTQGTGGNIVIPSFSIERSQELLYCINELTREEKISPLMVFLDSPMAIKVTEVFRNHPELFDKEMMEQIKNHESFFDISQLMLCRTTNESKAINNIKGTAVIIAGSGMCTGGRIKHHLVNNISRPESTVVFVGYQARGTLGRTILDGPKEVRILGRIHPVKARIERVHGFSGHADRDELFRWLSALKKPPKKTFIVHGEAETAETFAGFIREKTGWDVAVPSYQEQINID
jgi:metallo-beta-lactamase family protein